MFGCGAGAIAGERRLLLHQAIQRCGAAQMAGAREHPAAALFEQNRRVGVWSADVGGMCNNSAYLYQSRALTAPRPRGSGAGDVAWAGPVRRHEPHRHDPVCAERTAAGTAERMQRRTVRSLLLLCCNSEVDVCAIMQMGSSATVLGRQLAAAATMLRVGGGAGSATGRPAATAADHRGLGRRGHCPVAV